MLKRVALSAVKASAAAADSIRRPASGVVILLYHRVGGRSGLQVDLPVEMFTRQMEVLAEQGQAVSLDAALEKLATGGPGGHNPVVVTFDDGTADFVDTVVPILDRFRVPATLYVATDFIESGRSFPDDGRPASWSGLSEAMSTGLVTIGSHTHTHALLDRLNEARIEDELVRSIELIQDTLDAPGEHFAYPKAVAGSTAADAAVRERFRSAALGGNRANPPGRTDPHRLARSSIQVADSMRWFDHKLSGGMALEETLRRTLNRLRYARVTT
ncbi:MAG: polysaccharide deacetylase family protein [Actinomycetota bacterium]